MQIYLKSIIADLERCRGLWMPCPRCGINHFVYGDQGNRKSQIADLEICADCEKDEIARKDKGTPMRLTQWDMIRRVLRDKTFLDFLRGYSRKDEELECELIIDNSDMPATFNWDNESRITTYGAEYFGAIMEAPYEILPNGNIEIFCGDYRLGKEFVMAVAGYIGESEYTRMFEVPPMADIRLGSVSKTLDGLCASILLDYVDCDQQFCLNVSHWKEIEVQLRATYHPDTGIQCRYKTRGIEAVYETTEEERTLIRSAMEKWCCCSLEEAWRQYISD